MPFGAIWKINTLTLPRSTILFRMYAFLQSNADCKEEEKVYAGGNEWEQDNVLRRKCLSGI